MKSRVAGAALHGLPFRSLLRRAAAVSSLPRRLAGRRGFWRGLPLRVRLLVSWLLVGDLPALDHHRYFDLLMIDPAYQVK